uniref:C2H2-type domain-containing protein n=1 Tax=Periophthalmus magnuspinnatus TaxID=409849 RepID=A0A3B3ZVY5_9GOBI
PLLVLTHVSALCISFVQKPRRFGNMEESLRAPPDTPQQRMRKRRETFHCKDCGKFFTRAWALVQHLCTHPGEKAFRCDLCGSSFNSKGNLQKHQHMKHKCKGGKSKQMDTSNGLEKTEVANNKPKSKQDEKAADWILNEPEQSQKEASNNNTAKETEGADKLEPRRKDSAKKDSANNNLSCACCKCGRRFSNKTRLMTHLRFHEGKQIHRCLYCGNEFTSQSQLKIHERMHTGEKPYKCDHCPKLFYILAKLITHTRKFHKDLSRERYQCKYCKQKFLYKRFLTEHERTHKQDGDIPIEDPSEPSETPDQTTQVPNSNPKRQIQIHQLTHIGKEPFKCKYCAMDFCSETVLILHERSHTGEQPYKCDYCGRWFGILGNLYGHIRTQHPDKELPEKERPILSLLPSVLATPLLYLLHRLLAKFEKPYICEYCSKGFKTKHHLIEHRYIHIGKPFSCAVCGMGFVRKKKLEYHQKSHTGRDLFSCGECGYKFGSLQKLKTHKLKKHPDKAHISNDKYKCKYCDETYSHYCNLVKHMKEHNEKRS